MGGDISRVEVVVGVEKYRGGQERMLESLLEGRIVERRVTIAAKENGKGSEYSSSNTMKRMRKGPTLRPHTLGLQHALLEG